MNLNEIMKELENHINSKMDEMTSLGKKAKHNLKQIKELEKENDAIHLEMADILKQLEPVECIVRQQNPQVNELFDNLKNLVKE